MVQKLLKTFYHFNTLKNIMVALEFENVIITLPVTIIE